MMLVAASSRSGLNQLPSCLIIPGSALTPSTGLSAWQDMSERVRRLVDDSAAYLDGRHESDSETFH